MTGRVVYSGSTTGYFTNGQTYDMLTVGPMSGPSPSALAVVIGDNGQPCTVEVPSTGFTVSELYGPVRVI